MDLKAFKTLWAGGFSRGSIWNKATSNKKKRERKYGIYRWVTVRILVHEISKGNKVKGEIERS